MDAVRNSLIGAFAYLTGWSIASFLFAACHRKSDGQIANPDDELFLRSMGGCVFLPVVVVGFAIGSVTANFCPSEWHLAPWWGLPVGAAHFALSAGLNWLARRRRLASG